METVEKLRFLISSGRTTEVTDQIQVTLELADIESHVAERKETNALPLHEDIFQAMYRCAAGIILVTHDDFRREETGEYVLNESLYAEIGAAFVLYNRRIVLLWDKQHPVPGNFRGLRYCEFEGDTLTWETGVELMKIIKEFKRSVRQSG